MLQDLYKRPTFLVIGLMMLFVAPSTIRADDPYVVINNDTVDVILPNWEDNCMFQTIGSVTQVADTFNIIWSDTSSMAATCMCWFDLKATLINLPIGTYWAKTWVGTVMNDSFPNVDSVFTGAVQFSVDGAVLRDTVESNTWQSSCHSYQSVDPDFIPSTYALNISNYPNPFNPTTSIRYSIPEMTAVSLTIYNQLGYEVNTLVNTQQSGGDYEIQWNGTDAAGRHLSSGVYLCQVRAAGFSKTVKLVFLK